jgi:hypothetical protein
MDFQFGLGGIITFCCITPTHPIPSHVAPITKTTMLVQAGGDVMTSWVTRPCQLWDKEHQGGFVGVENEVGDVRAPKIVGTSPFYA